MNKFYRPKRLYLSTKYIFLPNVYISLSDYQVVWATMVGNECFMITIYILNRYFTVIIYLKVESYIQLKIHNFSMSVVHLIHVTTEMIKSLQYLYSKGLNFSTLSRQRARHKSTNQKMQVSKNSYWSVIQGFLTLIVYYRSICLYRLHFENYFPARLYQFSI